MSLGQTEWDVIEGDPRADGKIVLVRYTCEYRMRWGMTLTIPDELWDEMLVDERLRHHYWDLMWRTWKKAREKAWQEPNVGIEMIWSPFSPIGSRVIGPWGRLP